MNSTIGKTSSGKPVTVFLSTETAKALEALQNQLQRELGFKPTRQDCILYVVKFWQRKQSPS